MNTISYPWIYNSEQKGWYNEDKKCFLIKIQANTVSFLNSELNSSSIKSQLDQLKFKKIGNEIGNNSKSEKIIKNFFPLQGTYENDNYLIILKNNIIGNNGQFAMVLTIIKK